MPRVYGQKDDLCMNYMKTAAEMFYALSGWKIDGVIPSEIKRCVLILAPHTSNSDLLYARMMFFLDKRPAYFLIKSDYMRSPFKGILECIGAIGVERKQSTDMVERLSALINAQEEIILGIAPEGTRGFSKRWKTGFYQIALEAKVPIALLYLDYRHKAVGVNKILEPSGDFESDMKVIENYYATVHPRYPDKYNPKIFVPKNPGLEQTYRHAIYETDAPRVSRRPQAVPTK